MVAPPLIGFKKHLHAETIQGQGTFLVSPRGVTRVRGRSMEQLAPLLDGTRTLAEVLGELPDEVSAPEVSDLLGRLARVNLVGFQAEGQEDGAAAAYWDLAGLEAPSTPPTVDLVDLRGGDVDRITQACHASGLTVRARGEMSLVLCEDYLDPGLAKVNAQHLADGRPWLLASPGGADAWVGPVFRPGDGPCWCCLAARLRQRRSGETFARRFATALPPEASLPACGTLAMHAAVLEVAKWLRGLRYPGQNAVWTLDTLTLNGAHHRVAQRPQCLACGNPAMVADRTLVPVRPRSRTKAEGGGNGHRALPPEQVLQQYEHLIDPVIGVVEELRRHPGSPAALPSYLAGPNLALAGSSPSSLWAGLRNQSGGKGATELEAKVSALGEAVERYSGTRAGDELTVRARYLDVAEHAVHPDALQLFHPHQFRDRERWNATHPHFHHVPEPFDQRAVIDWTPLWSLHDQSPHLLPTKLLYFEPGAGIGYGWADSNGNAAGGSIEDAILQGFFELVERDAVALWWYNRTRQPAVCLDSFADPWISGLREIYRGLHRELWVLDLTSDLGIPAMAAISRRTDKPAEDIMLGFGAHLDPHVALRRSLTELGQFLPAAETGDLDDPFLRSWWAEATVANQGYLLPAPDREPRLSPDFAYRPTRDLAQDIQYGCAIARAHDLDILVLDQTRPDVELPVVKVVVPGLRHFWARFAPGRLYDVPVRLGRLARPTPYDELNPIPLFL